MKIFSLSSQTRTYHLSGWCLTSLEIRTKFHSQSGGRTDAMQRTNEKVTTVVKEEVSASSTTLDLDTGIKHSKQKKSTTTAKQTTETKESSIGWGLKYTTKEFSKTPVEIDHESGSDSEVEDIGTSGLRGFIHVASYKYSKSYTQH